MNKNLLRITHENVDSEWNLLMSLVKERPDIGEFVEYILEYGGNNFGKDFYWESLCKRERIGKSLLSIIFTISEFDISLVNPYHFNTRWIQDLVFFIHRYITGGDGFSFILNEYGNYEAVSWWMATEYKVLRDTKLLILLAKCLSEADEDYRVWDEDNLCWTNQIDYSEFEKVLIKSCGRLPKKEPDTPNPFLDDVMRKTLEDLKNV